MRPQGVHLGGKEMRHCDFCGNYLRFSETGEYIKVNGRRRNGEKCKLNFLACEECQKKIRSAEA